jgi:hypothetical protein
MAGLVPAICAWPKKLVYPAPIALRPAAVIGIYPQSQSAGGSGTTILPPTRSGTYTAHRPCAPVTRNGLGHVIGTVAAVLSGLETQAGAIAARVLRAHGLG